MPRVSGYLVTGLDFQAAYNEGRVQQKAAIPNTQNAMDVSTINTYIYISAIGGATNRCPSWNEIAVPSDGVTFKYGTTLANAQAASNATFYVKYLNGPFTVNVTRMFTGSFVLDSAYAPDGYYLNGSTWWQITGGAGLITATGVTNFTMNWNFTANGAGPAQHIEIYNYPSHSPIYVSQFGSGSGNFTVSDGTQIYVTLGSGGSGGIDDWCSIYVTDKNSASVGADSQYGGANVLFTAYASLAPYTIGCDIMF